MVEAGHAFDAIGEDYAVGAFVEGAGDGAEAFLPGCVPDLQLHDSLADFNRLRSISNADCRGSGSEVVAQIAVE